MSYTYSYSKPVGLRISLERAPDGRGYLMGVYGQPDQFADAIAWVRTLDPPERFYMPERRRWWVSCEGLELLATKLPAVADAWEAATRKEQSQDRQQQERASSAGQQSDAAGAASKLPRHIAEAFAALSLTPTAPPELVAAARRVFGKLYHPDAGGDLRRMQTVNAACDTLEQWIAQNRQSSATADGKWRGDPSAGAPKQRRRSDAAAAAS